ncbi:MAG TPA: hypothetical protein VFA70_08755 [Dehalococcoidia bacterium]|nr:hypothetical protein [Dehalococcoidia bacterium]
MKRALALVVVVGALGLAACGGNNKPSTPAINPGTPPPPPPLPTRPLAATPRPSATPTPTPLPAQRP